MDNRTKFQMIIFRNVIAVFSLFLLIAPTSIFGNTFQVNGGGGSILDNTTTTATGTFSGVTGSITGIDSVIITDLNHSYVGDVVARLSFGGQFFYLFQRIIALGPNPNQNFGETSNLGGTYAFVPFATQTIDTAAVGLLSNQTIPAGDYIPAWQGIDSLSQARGFNTVASLFSVFNGLDPNGTWTLEIRDNVLGDIGSFSSFQVNGTYVAVPEPASMVLLAVGATSMLVARSKKRLLDGVKH